MIEAVALSFLIGLLRRGTIRSLASLDLKGTEWIFFGAVLQYGSVWLAARGVPFFAAYGGLIFVVSFIPLLYGVWRSLHLPGMAWVGVGLALNMLVIAANGGRMPVDAQMAAWAGLDGVEEALLNEPDFRHVLMDEKTRLRFLGDVIPVPRPFPRPGVASVGDLFIVAGLFLLVQRGMVGGRRRTLQCGRA